MQCFRAPTHPRSCPHWSLIPPTVETIIFKSTFKGTFKLQEPGVFNDQRLRLLQHNDACSIVMLFPGTGSELSRTLKRLRQEKKDFNVRRGLFACLKSKKRGIVDGVRQMDYSLRNMTDEERVEAYRRAAELGFTEENYRPSHHEANGERRDREKALINKRIRDKTANDPLTWTCQFCNFADSSYKEEPETKFDTLNNSSRTQCHFCSHTRADQSNWHRHKYPWTLKRWRCPKCYRAPASDKRITVSGLHMKCDRCGFHYTHEDECLLEDIPPPPDFRLGGR